MIFVTVGTHEQPFDRLVEEIDRLKQANIIDEDVVIQKNNPNLYAIFAKRINSYSNLIDNYDEEF